MIEQADAFRNLRVAVVGLGSIGNRHLENLGRLGVRHRVVIRRAGRTNQQFQPPDDATVVRDADAAIATGLDAALICTPSSMHLESARPFLEAGVPILVEKPVEAHPAAARELAELAARRNTYAAVAYCMRFHPAYLAAAEFLRRGELGTLESAEAHFHTYLPNWHPYEDYRQSYAARPELGGGVLPTLDHEIDFLLWTLGPAAVEHAELVDGQQSLQIDVPATAELHLRHSAGGTSRVSLSFDRKEFSRGFVFRGANGTLSFDFGQGNLIYSGNGPNIDQAQPVVLARSGQAGVAQMYLDMLRATLGEISIQAKPGIPLSAGCDALEICEQAKRWG